MFFVYLLYDYSMNKQKGESRVVMTLLIAILIIVLVGVAVYLVQLSSEDLASNTDAQNATSTNSNSNNSTTNTNPPATTSPNAVLAENCGFKVFTPAVNTVVSFPLAVNGVIDSSNYRRLGCNWGRFEGQGGTAEVFAFIKGEWVPVSTWKDRGTKKPIMLSEDWTSTTTRFSINLFLDERIASLKLDEGYQALTSGTKLKAVFTEDNAQGIPNPDKLEIPLVYAGPKTDTMKVTIFLNDMNSPVDCGAVYPVVRTVPKTIAVANASLQALFMEENVALQPLYNGIKLQGTTAIVDFKRAALTYLDSPACMQAAIKSPIEKTLLQYPTIKKVEYSIEGKIKTDWDA